MNGLIKRQIKSWRRTNSDKNEKGKDEKGKTIADPQKFASVIKAVERAQQNPTKQNTIYAYQLLRDAFPDSKIPTSVWDDPEEVLSHLQ